MRTRQACVIAIVMLVAGSGSPASGQTTRALEGMWSDPPQTIIGVLCAAACSDAAIDLLNSLIDDPANDGRPFGQLLAQARNRHAEYIRSLLTPAALQAYPLDPADDPALIKCEPYGLARQIFSRHQLQIRSVDRDRLELRYGEWDARRVITMSGASRPDGRPPTRLGYSTGRWENDVLVIDTSGATSARAGGALFQLSDRLRVTERYTRASDGKTLWLTATLTDPVSLKAPLVLKRMWRWAPESTIAPYVDCEVPASVKRGTVER